MNKEFFLAWFIGTVPTFILCLIFKLTGVLVLGWLALLLSSVVTGLVVNFMFLLMLGFLLGEFKVFK